ncbi:hypothetical protein GOB33_18825 [Sinorhizobium meliloti]|nr:hypothetical protein [Sinorhizobium meliloti]
MKKPQSKKVGNTAPPGLVRYATNRTGASLQKIENGKALVERMLQSGELASRVYGDEKKELEQAAFMAICGLGPNFLNGEKHRKTTKPDVLRFLAEINKRLPASMHFSDDRRDASGKEDSWKIKYMKLEALYEQLKGSFDESQESYARLATRAHHWWLDLRQVRRENRVLKAKSGVKVVPILR